MRFWYLTHWCLANTQTSCASVQSYQFLLLAYQNRADVEDSDQNFAPFSYSVIEHTCLNQGLYTYALRTKFLCFGQVILYNHHAEPGYILV